MNASGSLYLIQANAQSTAAALDQLTGLWSPNDQIVMMGESLWCYEHDFFKQAHTVYALESDLNLLPQVLQGHFHRLDYASFADLCLKFKRCIRLT